MAREHVEFVHESEVEPADLAASAQARGASGPTTRVRESGNSPRHDISVTKRTFCRDGCPPEVSIARTCPTNTRARSIVPQGADVLGRLIGVGGTAP